MPTYEYACSACGKNFELFQAITDPPARKCALCGSRRARRLISGGGGVIFHGSGFYQTDYRSAAYTEAAKKDKEAGTAKPSATGDSGKTAGAEAKTEKKPGAKSGARRTKAAKS